MCGFLGAVICLLLPDMEVDKKKTLFILEQSTFFSLTIMSSPM